MLFRLLKNVKKWVSRFILDSKLGDVEERFYFGEKNDSNKG